MIPSAQYLRLFQRSRYYTFSSQTRAGTAWYKPSLTLTVNEQIKSIDALELWLKVNGEERQRGLCELMLFKVPQLISHISHIMTLEEGDLVLTGTPEGVGPVHEGEVIEAGITDLISMKFPVIRRDKSTEPPLHI